MPTLIAEMKKKHDLSWLRFSMSYHRFLNLSELLCGDLSSKLNKDIVSLDFMDRKCNCAKSNCINGACPHDGDCRKSFLVCRVTCKITGKNCLGQTQQHKKRRIQQHSNETRRLFDDKESFDSHAHHFAKQFNNEPTPKQTQKITDHETVWQGNPISIVKTFGTLHCKSCVKEQCQIKRN